MSSNDIGRGSIQVVNSMLNGIIKAIRDIMGIILRAMIGAIQAIFSALKGIIRSGKTVYSKKGIKTNREIMIKFQVAATELLKDRVITLFMNNLKIGQKEQSFINILYVGSEAGAEAGYKKYKKTGDINQAVKTARNEAIISATGQACREIPNFADGGSRSINYAESKICNKAARHG